MMIWGAAIPCHGKRTELVGRQCQKLAIGTRWGGWAYVGVFYSIGFGADMAKTLVIGAIGVTS